MWGGGFVVQVAGRHEAGAGACPSGQGAGQLGQGSWCKGVVV